VAVWLRDGHLASKEPGYSTGESIGKNAPGKSTGCAMGFDVPIDSHGSQRTIAIPIAGPSAKHGAFGTAYCTPH